MNKGLYYLLLLFLITLLGVIGIDYGYGYYTKKQFEKNTKEIFTKALDEENLDSVDDYENYITNEFSKINENDLRITFVEEEDYYLLSVTKSYTSFVKAIESTFKELKDKIFGDGDTTYSKNRDVRALYKGYYDKNKKVVIEEYIETVDDAL